MKRLLIALASSRVEGREAQCTLGITRNHASRATSVDHCPNGESLTYCEPEARTNRLAHLLPARGLCRVDHYAIFMEDNAHYIEWGGLASSEGRRRRRIRCPNDDLGEEVQSRRPACAWWGRCATDAREVQHQAGERLMTVPVSAQSSRVLLCNA
jgi:hypothetical protein